MQGRLSSLNAADPGDFPFTQLDITLVSCIKTVDSGDIQLNELDC